MSLLIGLRGAAMGLLSLFFTTTTVPTVESVPESVSAWETLWTQVLRRNVDEAGRVDFESLVLDHTDLDRVVAFIAATDPDQQPDKFPTHASRLAYYINSYNALAMYGVVDAGYHDSLGGFRKYAFFYLRKFSIGGRWISLYDFENNVIRPIGEEKVHFALNCMVVGCPRLPRAAFSADELQRQLDIAARAFIAEERNVRVDPVNRKLWLSAIFEFYTEDFLAHAPSLIAYVNEFRSEKLRTDFDVRFIPYNWTVNRQPKRRSL